MSLNKKISSLTRLSEFSFKSKDSGGFNKSQLEPEYATFRKWRHHFMVGTICTFLAACSGGPDLKEGQIGFVEGYYGGVAADEPRAVLVGREILTAGGNAVDAAVGTYFALSVTLPSSASLGGGGVCLVHDQKTEKLEMLDFLPRAPKTIAPNADRPVAIPGNPRGFYALHSKYGTLRWEGLISPAENLARFGNQVSRAFSSDLNRVSTALMRDQGSQRVFGGKGGISVGESDFIEQLDLAVTLTVLRTKGPGDFYNGRFARQFVESVNRAGGGLKIDDLRSYVPVWREPIKVKVDNNAAYFTAPPVVGGVTGAQFLSLLVNDDRYEDADEIEKRHMFVDAAMRTYANRAGWLSLNNTVSKSPGVILSESQTERLTAGYNENSRTSPTQVNPALGPRQENPSATSFVTVDKDGNAVACNLSMNNLFGTGRMAGETGILLSARPGNNGRGPISLGPVIVINDHNNQLIFGGAASGGVAAPVALIGVLADAMIRDIPLQKAISQGRVHHGGYPDQVYYESSVSAEVVAELKAKGHDLVPTKALGLVNSFHCPEGLPANPQLCTMNSDPRGFGLASHASN
ncbi:MAG: gamma-glutamyltransferase family protein [Rhodospirillales bacterium]|nr:gamma-glutamyltransferase family protein [Rhodospirillales bacterium]